MYIKRLLMHLLLIALVVLLVSCSVLSLAYAGQPDDRRIMELNDSSINSTLAGNSFFVLDAYKPGCEPCQRMNASLSELSVELGGQIAFGRINALENRKTAERCNITSYPTLIIFKNETVIDKKKGFGSKSRIVSHLLELKPDLNTSLVILEKTSAASKPSTKVQKNCSDIKKTEQPMLEAFIVSYCPFGLQMQRVLLGIVSQIPDLSQNIIVRYIIEMEDGNVTSMHGQEESDENLRQICIREEQPDKYWKYISCFLKSGNSSQCLRTAAVSEASLSGCLGQESRGLKYAMDDLNKTQQFDITGSPTLLLNGEIVKESDFGGRTEQALKNLLCCGFAARPDFCSTNLSTEKAKTGFTSKAKKGDIGGPVKAPKSLETMPLAEVGEKNPAKPVLVTDRTMNKALQEYPIFVLMGFADWCGYCQMMNATVQELSRELQGQVVFGLMDAEKNNQTAEIYNLFSYPRLLIFLNGSLISTQSEYKSSSELMRVLKENIPNLDKSRSGLVLPSPSLSIRRQDVTMDMVGNISDIDGNDTTLKYLEMILDVAAVNRTTGNTINIFILNIDD